MELHAIENEPEYLNLQTELVWLQQWLIANRKRLIVIFEGRDTAGKGGAIMRFVRFINPRHYKIVALTKPTELESGQWYFQRYVQHLPDPGSIAFFDRSWYNRAVVEPVMGFCTEEQYQLFIKQVLQLEKCSRKMAYPSSNSGFPSTMRNRSDALKKGRPTRSSKYKEIMFTKTSTTHCPWVIVQGHDRDKARLEAMRYVLNCIDYEKKGETGERLKPDTKILRIWSKSHGDT